VCVNVNSLSLDLSVKWNASFCGALSDTESYALLSTDEELTVLVKT